MRKKVLSICSILTACLLLAGTVPALASETTASSSRSFSGKITYNESISLLAPFGGQLEDYTVHAGDAVASGETLFSINTTKVYAPDDGIIRGVRAAAGDDAQSVIDRYSALAYLEPSGQFIATATTSGAYKSNSNGNENRLLHEGETVYLRSTGDYDRTGTGFITIIDGSSFTVEIAESNLEINERVNIYRDSTFSSESRIATSGTVKKNSSVAITAEGSILQCYVEDGDTVKRGDLLFETVTGTLDDLQGGSNTVTSPVDGVLIAINQNAGDTVSKGDVLATLYDQSTLLVQANVDEADLDYLRIGDRVKITFDALTTREPMEGTIDTISSISTSEAGDAIYTAYIRLPYTEGLREGMSVSVYTQ